MEIGKECLNVVASHEKVMSEIDSLVVTIIKITDKQEKASRIHQIAKDLHSAQSSFTEEFRQFLTKASQEMVLGSLEIQVNFVTHLLSLQQIEDKFTSAVRHIYEQLFVLSRYSSSFVRQLQQEMHNPKDEKFRNIEEELSQPEDHQSTLSPSEVYEEPSTPEGTSLKEKENITASSASIEEPSFMDPSYQTEVSKRVLTICLMLFRQIGPHEITSDVKHSASDEGKASRSTTSVTGTKGPTRNIYAISNKSFCSEAA